MTIVLISDRKIKQVFLYLTKWFQQHTQRCDQLNFLFYKHLGSKLKIRGGEGGGIKIQKYAIYISLFSTWHMYVYHCNNPHDYKIISHTLVKLLIP